MGWDEEKALILAEQASATGEIIQRLKQGPISYPADFQTRLEILEQTQGRTICHQTALFLLGLTNYSTLQSRQGILLISYTTIARYLTTERTDVQIPDKDLLVMANEDVVAIQSTHPLVLLTSVKYPTSVHWMVTDPTDPSKILQTPDFQQRFKHTTLREVITTGNFGMLSASLKDPSGQWTFQFCR